MSFISLQKAQNLLAEQARARRLQMNLTQQGLAQRADVAVSSLRKFERTGVISLESFLKLHMILGGLAEILAATEVKNEDFSSLDEVLTAQKPIPRQRGRRT